ncbi:hypothetical protein CVT91_11375 [Candidatus Atribacteria bacterium HGW-Atribacteria-1]|nr:MAG: hypothetical protein CVT91_11375 [Candidatus Atribacteria bacterium HGW-Atribacteria-1]
MFINGSKKGAIYNLATGDIISLDEEWSTIVKLLEKRVPINELCILYNQKKVEEILNGLFNNNIGKYSEKWYYNEKHRRGVVENLISDTNFRIFKCFIELPTDCSLNCTFCTKPKTFPCQTCSISSKRPLFFDEDFYYKILKRILTMDVQNLIFYGGDPLTSWEKLINILKFSRDIANKGIGIFVITNGTLFNTEKAEFFVGYKIQPIIMFDCTGDWNEKVFSKINMIEPTLKVLKNNNIPFSITAIIDKNSEIAKKEIKNVLSKLSPQLITYLIVLENLSEDEIPQSLMNMNIVRINAETFYHRIRHHPCLYGTMAITADKKLIPCPALKDDILLDLSLDDRIDMPFEERLIFKYWDLTLSKVEYCKECEFRYGCIDCRAIDKILTGDIYGKKLCSYKRGR